MRTYSIVRFYQKREKRVLKEGASLEEAQEHCNDPETSFKTCTSSEGLRETQMYGPWFDGYLREE